MASLREAAADGRAEVPLISVLINNFNYAEFLGRAIDSALDQDHPRKEVIVVDDGSIDRSREVLKAYAGRITLIEKENGGQASCFNAGFAASVGGIVCLLDADDAFRPHKLSRLAEEYAAAPSIGWLFHALERRDQDGRELSPEWLPGSGYLDCRRRFFLGNVNAHMPATSALTFRRDILARLLPMAQGDGISIGDHYLKYGAAALSPGLRLNEPLGVQYVHGANLYTLARNRQTRARIFAATAVALRDRVPQAEGFADNLMGTALAVDGALVRDQYRAYAARSGPVARLRTAGWRAAKTLKAALRPRSAHGAG